MRDAIGIDFGTTNSSIARVDGDGKVQMAEFAATGGSTGAYRSLLYLEQHREHGRAVLKSWTGPAGIDAYLAAETKGRLIQSLKSFLASRGFSGTEIFGRQRALEELIAKILQDLREKAETLFGTQIRSAVVGRPVRFAGAENDDDDRFAQTRLEAAFHLAGFESVQFELEPVAAAHYYESGLDHDELILVGDFGGGTSDFSLIHAGPSIRRRGRTLKDLLGNAGIGLAGDAFDSKIIRHLVSPALGAGTGIRSMHKLLPVPVWVYAKLERWHHLSFLKANDVMNMLRSVRAQAVEPEKIDVLLHLIQEDLGYQLHRAVQQLKGDLSSRETARFCFSDGIVSLDALVKRNSFESWIAEELRQIESCIDSLLSATGVAAPAVDRVFLTGGTSFVPAVRRVFEARFGAERIRSGNEFTSVARGLALKAAEARFTTQSGRPGTHRRFS